MKQTPEAWFESLPVECVALRVRVGDGQKLETVGLVALQVVCAELRALGVDFAPLEVSTRDGLREKLLDLAADGGWPDECPTLRVHALDRAGLELTSFRRTVRTATAPTAAVEGAGPLSIMAESNRSMADACVRMMGKAEGAIGVLTTALGHRETVNAGLLDTMVDALQGKVLAEGEQMAATVTHLLEQAESAGEAEDDDGMAREGMRLLRGVAKRFGIEIPEDEDGGGLDAMLRDPVGREALRTAVAAAEAEAAAKAAPPDEEPASA